MKLWACWLCRPDALAGGLPHHRGPVQGDNGAYMGARIQDVLNSYVAQTTSPEDVIEQQRKRIVELEAAVAEKG